jgi:hypothetical protein
MGLGDTKVPALDEVSDTPAGHFGPGGDIGWGAKLNGVVPFAYLKDVPQCMVDDHPVSRLDELLPWIWEPPQASL